MGPLLHAISPEVPGSLGEPVGLDGLLCVWEWQVRLGAWGGRLSGLLSVSTWLLAPGGQKAALSAFSGAHFLFGRENSKTPHKKCSSSRRAFSRFCWLWLVGKGPCRGSRWGFSHSSLSPLEPRRGPGARQQTPPCQHGQFCLGNRGPIYYPLRGSWPAWHLLSAPRACGSRGS